MPPLIDYTIKVMFLSNKVSNIFFVVQDLFPHCDCTHQSPQTSKLKGEHQRSTGMWYWPMMRYTLSRANVVLIKIIQKLYQSC